MRESKIQAYLLQELNKLPNCKAIKVHVGDFMEAGTPDIDCCLNGQAIKIEVKREGGKASAIQEHRMKEWRDAGAVAMVIAGHDHAVEVISDFKEML